MPWINCGLGVSSDVSSDFCQHVLKIETWRCLPPHALSTLQAATEHLKLPIGSASYTAFDWYSIGFSRVVATCVRLLFPLYDSHALNHHCTYLHSQQFLSVLVFQVDHVKPFSSCDFLQTLWSFVNGLGKPPGGMSENPAPTWSCEQKRLVCSRSLKPTQTKFHSLLLFAHTLLSIIKKYILSIYLIPSRNYFILILAVSLSRIGWGEVVSFCVPAIF